MVTISKLSPLFCFNFLLFFFMNINGWINKFIDNYLNFVFLFLLFLVPPVFDEKERGVLFIFQHF
jgi:hypothetical protein